MSGIGLILSIAEKTYHLKVKLLQLIILASLIKLKQISHQDIAS